MGVRGGLRLAAPLKPGFCVCIGASDWSMAPTKGAMRALIGRRGGDRPLYIRETRGIGLYFVICLLVLSVCSAGFHLCVYRFGGCILGVVVLVCLRLFFGSAVECWLAGW